jgi:hypothetical protein
MPRFVLRGLEIHNRRMWQWAAVQRALDLMDETGLNALILHQNDLVDAVVLPSRYFTQDLMYSRWPIRRSTVVSNQLYMKQVVRAVHERGARCFFEVKELWFPDEILEMHPELRSANGAVCPTHPFWSEFVEAKYTELLDVLPDLGGVIVSPATRESRASIAANGCGCERCRSTEPVDWYTTLLAAMYRPLASRGKSLVVRDFTYTDTEQGAVIAAATAVSSDIVVALKNVPHDFWPTFPDNPKIGSVPGVRQWVEFDVLGQYCGLGVYPCSLVSDLRARLDHCAEHGVEGVWFRTDWELLNETSAFNSLNLLNLYAGAALARDAGTPVDRIYETWVGAGLRTSLHQESVHREHPVPTAPDAAARLGALMENSWSILRKTVYTRGHVFQYSSKVTATLYDFLYVPTLYHRRDQWEPGANAAIEPTRRNLAAIVEEKSLAVAEVLALGDELRTAHLGLGADMTQELATTLDLFAYFVQSFRYSVCASFATYVAVATREEADIAAAQRWVDELGEFSSSLRARMRETAYPHYVYWTLDADLLRSIHEDLCGHVLALTAGHEPQGLDSVLVHLRSAAPDASPADTAAAAVSGA